MNQQQNTEMALRILLVEDEAIISMVLKMELEQAGFQVLQPAECSEKALETALENPLDVVIMDIDIQVPRDGIELGQLMEEERHLPVIFLTGQSNPDRKEKAEGLANCIGYFVKPVQTESLVGLIRQKLDPSGNGQA